MTFLALASGGAVLASSVALAAPTATTPRVAVTATNPVAVGGTHFRPLERVRVVVTTGAGNGTRYVRANRAGSFRVRFSTLGVSGCPWYRVRAVGDHGSRAAARLLPECPNGPAP
ncbi:MAG TPA: hypothetical protein VFK17_03230 [Gaiellaceae bacterium]|jgi:hypothetical protein|nr:hypothetical protein [Gaiellaceae bacterium]